MTSPLLALASFNVNGVNGRLPRLLAWLARISPDIVCLQELKTDDSKFPAAALEAAGYGAVWHGQRAHHGVAILTRGETPGEIRRGVGGDDADDAQARYVEARTKGLVVASVYLPNGNPVPSANFEYKLRWFSRFVDRARELAASREPVVLAGDLNVVPTDFDIYNAWWWRDDAVMQPQAREAYRAILDQGWTDAVRKLHPRSRMYSYWTSATAHRRDHGFRLDFVLLNAVASARLREAGVDAVERGGERPSDHAPVWIKLEAQAPAGA